MRMRMRGVADVEQQAEAGARAAGEADLRIDRDVVALVRSGRRTLRSAAASAAGGAAAPRRAGRAWRTRAPAHRRAAAAARPHPARSPACPARPAASRSGLRGGTGSSLKMRGELTIAAFSGAASGTLITSSRNRAVFGSSMPPSWQPAASSAERTPAVPDT